MRIYYKSTGPAGFGSHTETRNTMIELLKHDGGYAYHYGCTRILEIGNKSFHKYFKCEKVQKYYKKLKKRGLL